MAKLSLFQFNRTLGRKRGKKREPANKQDDGEDVKADEAANRQVADLKLHLSEQTKVMHGIATMVAALPQRVAKIVIQELEKK